MRTPDFSADSRRASSDQVTFGDTWRSVGDGPWAATWLVAGIVVSVVVGRVVSHVLGGVHLRPRGHAPTDGLVQLGAGGVFVARDHRAKAYSELPDPTKTAFPAGAGEE